MYEFTPDQAQLAVQLFDGSPDGLVVVDSDGVIVAANRSAGTLFGYGDDLVGTPVDRLVPDESRDVHADHRDGYVDDPHARPMGTDLRLFGQRRTGEMFPVEISLTPVSIGTETHVVATIRDVTDRQRRSAKLLLHEDRERTARDLHDQVIQRLFAAGMSLQSVTDLVDSPVARERVIAVTDELDETIRAVRGAIFSVSGRGEFESLRERVARLVKDRAHHLGFVPTLHISGEIDEVSEHVAAQLIATLSEALSNVARHAEASEASVHLSRDATSLELVVRDDGCGIDGRPKPLGGLSNLMWRAAELGGSCSVEPVDPSGTALSWRVPT